ncbi:hypothetical protein GP486_002786 [Trichoglossum hirsutum]|uniref:Pentatricopeptide repeat protein n=1 Tax=Trichoglossum hirsutum TaxID=265104 RepID=A0A9P8LEJ4_9PEZI|nr:hypothetical protein GP486_002786 [Trichoglossum hirsutum]
MPATTATPRRSLKAGDAFTAFYSAIFATAAVLDAKIKEDRRNDLDRIIEDTRGELRKIGETAVLRQKSENASETKISDEENLISDARCRGIWGYSEQRNWAGELESEKLGRRFARKTTEQRFPESSPLEMPRGSLTHGVRGTEAGPRGNLSERDGVVSGVREIPARHKSAIDGTTTGTVTDTMSKKEHAPSEQKRRELEGSIRKLVARLLHHSTVQHDVEREYARSIHSFKAGGQNGENIHELIGRLTLLRKYPSQLSEPTFGSHRYPRYSHQDSRTPLEVGRRLNWKIRKIFEQSIKGYVHLDAVIPEICYNLLISTTPPNVDTYNILIIYLTRLRRNALVEIVLDSMLETGLTLNKVTVSSLIKFYTASNDPDGFNRLLKLMRGLDGGLLHGSWSLSSFPDSDWVNARRGQAIWRGRYRMLSDTAPCSIVTFGAAINAALKFGMVKQAQLWYRSMVREGYAPTPPVLTSILRSCALRREWLSGWKTWLKLKEAWEFGGSPEEYPWVAYSWVLRLCRWCNRRAEFEDIFKEAVQRGLHPLGRPMSTKTKGLPIVNNGKSPRTENICRAHKRQFQDHQLEIVPSHNEAWDKLMMLREPCPPVSSGTWHALYEGPGSSFDGRKLADRGLMSL